MTFLYPWLGSATEKAIQALKDFSDQKFVSFTPRVNVIEQPPEIIRPIEHLQDTFRGLLYMAFGDKARAAMNASVKSLRAVGCRLPVAVIGDAPVNDAFFIEWQGESPFDGTQPRNFQFRAGRVKPKFYELSPFERTLYVDCDTEFLADITNGFGFLSHWDFAIAQERLALNQLYNDRNVNWQHDLAERDMTVSEFGGDGNFPFVNSGVFFFRKSEAARDLFERWYAEWMRIQGWDEQKALMRAINQSPARTLVLSEIWNYPHREGAKIIYHAYGRGAARSK